jgi:hypothetical protein
MGGEQRSGEQRPEGGRAGWGGPAAGAAAGLLLAASFGLCTQDDAFISLRYARNLVEGHGLVYNVGEAVEGYTNLLWTLLLAGLIALGIDAVVGSAVLGALCWAGALAVAARCGAAAGGPRAGLVAAAVAALSLQAALEAVEGLETALYALLIAAGVLALAPRAEGEGPSNGRGWTSTLAFALAALTRPEAPLLAALAHGGLLLGDPTRRSARLRAALVAGAALAAQQAALLAWRLHTYGEPLPNTFYAKVGGAAWGRGLRYIADHALHHPALWGLAALGAGLALRSGGAARSRALLALLPVLGQLLWVAKVGGDFKPTGRFLMPLVGPLALLAGAAAGPVLRAPRGGVALGAVILVGAAVTGAGAETVYGWAAERRANLEARRTVGLFLRENMPPDTLMAIHSAGAIPYYAGLPTIDMWGLTDHHIARAPAPTMGEGLAGHEKSDPAYVFGRQPALYLPEDKVFTLKAWPLTPDPGFPADFAERYQSISVPLEGRVLNLWVRTGFLAGLAGGG